MGQEYFINSQELEDRIRTLLPSQGGAGAGFDLSASTQIIPVIDVSESAEGSNLRADLQTAQNFATELVTGTGSSGTQTVLSTTGYFKCVLTYMLAVDGGAHVLRVFLDDGSTEKDVYYQKSQNGSAANTTVGETVMFNVFLSAGKTLKIASDGAADTRYSILTHQIASIDGTLTNPI